MSLNFSSLPKATLLTLLTLLLTLITTNCSYFKLAKYTPTKNASISTPQLWAQATTGQHKKISTGWLQEFSDPQMTKLVRQALLHNPNLAVTAERLKATHQETIIGRANRLPTLSSRVSKSQDLDTDQDSDSTYRLNFVTSWEIDLWGRLRDLHHSQKVNELAALVDYRSSQLSLASRTAKAYINLISSEQQRLLAQSTVDSYSKNLRIISRNYKAGLPGTRALDVQFGRNNVTSAQRTLARRTLQVSQAARTLQVLLGRYPTGKLPLGRELPKLKKNIPAGLPAHMLERRPDLTAARLRLYASALNAKAAHKNLLPSLSLNTTTSDSGSKISLLLDPSKLATTIASNFAQNLFDGKTKTSLTKIAYYQNQALLKAYTATALEALQEVESAIQSDHSLRQQESLLQQEVTQATLAQKQAERDYSEGIENASILSVLEAQRRALNAHSSLISLQRDRLLNRIDLHTALGGDFFTRPKSVAPMP